MNGQKKSIYSAVTKILVQFEELFNGLKKKTRKQSQATS